MCDAYSEEDVKRIIESVGELPPGKCAIEEYDERLGTVRRRRLSRKTVLRVELEALAELAAGRRWRSDQLTPLQLAKRFNAIVRAADRLLVAIHAGPDGDIEKVPEQYLYGRIVRYAAKDAAERALGARPDVPGKAIVATSLLQVAFLRKWVCAAERAARSEGKRARTDRHRGDAALREHVASLVELYCRIFERVPGTSVSPKGAAGGPLVAFVAACLRPIHGTGTPSAAAIRRFVRDNLGENRDASYPTQTAKSKSKKI